MMESMKQAQVKGLKRVRRSFRSGMVLRCYKLTNHYLNLTGEISHEQEKHAINGCTW